MFILVKINIYIFKIPDSSPFKYKSINAKLTQENSGCLGPMTPVCKLHIYFSSIYFTGIEIRNFGPRVPQPLAVNIKKH
jgi:hypothetical protein